MWAYKPVCVCEYVPPCVSAGMVTRGFRFSFASVKHLCRTLKSLLRPPFSAKGLSVPTFPRSHSPKRSLPPRNEKQDEEENGPNLVRVKEEGKKREGRFFSLSLSVSLS